MTIVAGFRCSGGVIICADRQISATDAYKFYEPKIKGAPGFGEALVFAYADLPSLAKEAQEKILRHLRGEFTERAVYDTCDEVLTEMGRIYGGLQLQLLVGMVSLPNQRKPSLLSFDGRGLHRVDTYAFHGIGDSSLVRFLVHRLYSPQMSIQETIDMGTYLIRKAGQYVDHCGGPIDVAVLANDSDSYELLGEQSIVARVEKMEKQEILLSDLFLRQPFSSSSEPQQLF